MKINSFCMSCLVQAQARNIQKFEDEEKKSFNDFLLSMEEELEKKIRSTKDPLATALCYARLGNYIDLSALSDVSTEKLLELFAKAEEESLDAEEYQHFLQDLKHGEYLVYLTDNCGEVVLDKLVIKLLKEQYPKLRIEVLVRGIPVTNDVDIEDAEYVGLTKLVPVFGNGSGIAGTELSKISQEAREKLERADVIIAKGQGNFETIHTCGLNIYYLFLCKCDWFMQRFHAKHLQGMFVNETRI